jgi:adenylate cyclase
MRQDANPGSAVVPPQHLRRSIRTWLVLAFAAILLFSTLPLVVFTYARIAALSEEEASDHVRRAARETALRVSTMFDPLTAAIGLMRFDPVATARSEAERDARLPAFFAVLASEPRIMAFYAASDSGDMILVRKGAAALHKAPPKSHFAVQSLSSTTQQGSEILRFFAEDGNAIPGGVVASAADYDPRERPWYRAAKATDGIARIEPYRFQSLNVLGITLARATPDRSAVIAGDVTLDGLQDFLREQRPTPGAAIVLLDGKGGMIASSDDRAGPELAALLATRSDADADAAGGEWHAASAPLRIGDAAEAWRVIVAIPRSEILAPATRTRDALLRLIPVFLVAAAVIALVLSGRIARPILAIEDAARRICRIDFSTTAPSRSLFTEIDRLQTAIETMRGALANFMRYVPADIVRELIASGREAGIEGTRREITIVFSDVQDFTALSEKLPPVTVTTLLSHYYDRMTRLYQARRGIVDKFIGDGIMALWNAPAEDEDHVANACLACLAARDSFESSPLPVPGTQRTFVTRFGIHTGEAVVGNVGGSERIQFTAVGAHVNLASRIEGLNKVYGTRILVSETVAHRVDALFEFRRIDDAVIAGLSERVSVYELIGERRNSADDPFAG